MDVEKQMLKGSPSRDLFKLQHKQTHTRHFGCDIDFDYIQTYPFPDIVCWIDFKTGTDDVTFAEAVAYNALVLQGLRGFIVCGNPQTGSFDIYEYLGGHHYKPTWTQRFVCSVTDWNAYHDWEASVREEYLLRFSATEQTHGR